MELKRLVDRRKALEELRERVLQLPSKVSYEQMVPISKVAFCPGKIIHTNEFKMAEENDSRPNLSKIDFISYIEAATILQERLAKLDKLIQVKDKDEDQLENDKSFHESVKSAEAIAEKSDRAKQSPATAPTNNPSKTTNNTNNTSTAPAQSKSSATQHQRVFEIREYLDGNSTSSEAGTGQVMDVTDQVEKMAQFTSKSEGNIPHGSHLNEDEAEFLRELAEISAGNIDNDSFDANIDEDIAVYNSQKRPLENMDDVFARIEAQQERQEALLQRRKAANTTSQPKKEGGGGWKSGFLSSGSSKPTKEPAVKKSTAANNTEKETEKETIKDEKIEILTAQPVVKKNPIRSPMTAAAFHQPTSVVTEKQAEPEVQEVVEEPEDTLSTTESRRVQFRSENDIHEIDNREQLAQKIHEMKIEERKAELIAKRAQEMKEAEEALKMEEMLTGKPRPPAKKPFTGMIMEKFP